MAVGPAGWSSHGGPLTCTETAIVIGLARWAQKNRRWYNAMIARNVCFGLFFGFATFSLFSLSFFVLALAFGSIGFGIHIASNPESVGFPSVAITTHGWAKFGPVNHLISQSPTQGIDLSIYTKIRERDSHTPSDHIESNQLRVSDSNNHLSVASLKALLESEGHYLNLVQNTEIKDFRLGVMSLNGAQDLENHIVSQFPPAANQSLAGVAVTELNQPLVKLAQDQIDWFVNVNKYNAGVIERVQKNQLTDCEPYQEWSKSLYEDGLNRTKIVLDSTIQGWTNSTHGVDAAEDALERSVAAEIIAQQEAVQRDMERAEEQIREREAEIEIENTRQREQLEIESNQLRAQIDAIGRQVNKIQSISIDSELLLKYAYGDTYGGGGDTSVRTNVTVDSYLVPNPAWSTRQAIVELAIGDQQSLVEKQNYVKKQIENIEGMKERMMGHLAEKKNERLARLEESKQRAMRAIRKDANEVRSLEKIHHQLNNTLREVVGSFWLQSHRYVDGDISNFQSVSTNIDEHFSRIQSSNDGAVKTLRKSPLSQHGGTPLYYHWIVVNGKLYGDTRIHSKIDFTKNSKPLSINTGLAQEHLGLTPQHVSIQSVPLGVFFPSLQRLKEVGIIDIKFFNKVSKIKISNIIGGP